MSKMVYTPAEAAEWLNLPVADVEEMIETGTLGFFLNGQPRINGDEIERYISREKKNANGTRNIREGVK